MSRRMSGSSGSSTTPGDPPTPSRRRSTCCGRLETTIHSVPRAPGARRPSARCDGPPRRRPTMVERALPTEAVAPTGSRRYSSPFGEKEDAEGLLLAHLARHPQAETAVTAAEVRWRSHDDAGAAASSRIRRPRSRAGISLGSAADSRTSSAAVRGRGEARDRGAAPGRNPTDVDPRARTSSRESWASAQAFELYALLSEKVPPRREQASSSAHGAPCVQGKEHRTAESWLRKQLGPEASALADNELATSAYGRVSTKPSGSCSRTGHPTPRSPIASPCCAPPRSCVAANEVRGETHC